MKRFICLLFVLVLLPVVSFADLPDLSGLSFDDLVRLRDQINLAIWNSTEWQQVKVPSGVYIIGRDIPAGHWTIKPPAGDSVCIEYFKEADETGKNVLDSLRNYASAVIADASSPYAEIIYNRETDFELKEGFYLTVVNGPYAIFEPYISKPSFEFK